MIPSIGGDATAMMMAAAKLATSATGPTKVDDVIDDINKKKQSIRSEADEQMNIGAAARKTEITAKQRWNWAFNKIVLQLNVSDIHKPEFACTYLYRIYTQTMRGNSN